jgi:hypothetical protein
MNNDWTRQRATVMVEQLAELDSEAFAEEAYRRLLGRQADSLELAAAREFLQQYASLAPGIARPEVPLVTSEGGTASEKDDDVSPAVAQACLDEESSFIKGAGEGSRSASESPEVEAPGPTPAELARIALLHALMNSNEMLYVD